MKKILILLLTLTFVGCIAFPIAGILFINDKPKKKWKFTGYTWLVCKVIRVDKESTITECYKKYGTFSSEASCVRLLNRTDRPTPKHTECVRALLDTCKKLNDRKECIK